MLDSYIGLLILHRLLAVASPLLFSLRVWRAARGRDPAAGWLRVLPHVLDTLLLAAGVGLAVILRASPLREPWLTAKLLALVAYIAVGHVAVRRVHSARARLFAWVGAMALIAYIIAVALTRDPAVGLR